MARLFIGRKTTGGGGALKIMRNNADDPNTTPSSQVDRFLFDSEVNDLGYATATRIIPDTSGFTPAGSNFSNCEIWRGDVSTNSALNVHEDRVEFHIDKYLQSIGRSYSYVPYCDFHYKSTQTGRSNIYGWYGDTGNSSNRHSLYGYGLIGNWIPASDPNRDNSANWQYFFDNHILIGRDKYNVSSDKSTGSAGAEYHNVPFHVGQVKALVWTFPLDDTDFTPPSGTPVAGQRNVLISPSIVKVARPGFDVGTATGRELIADSEHIPAKLLRSGSIASIASQGYVDIPIGLAVPENTFVDGQFAATTDPYFSIPGAPPINGTEWQDALVIIEYSFPSTSTLRIWNLSNFAVKGRYLVFGSGDGESSGSGPVLRVSDQANPPYAQLVRPGADDPPHWDDIIVDTRCSYLPLLASGYIARSSMTATSGSDKDYYGQYVGAVTVNCPNGYVPYVKAMCRQTSPYTYYLSNDLSGCWMKPHVERIFDNWDNSFRSENTRRIRVEGNTVKFYCSDTYYNNTVSSPEEMTQSGWAYHIFAVPSAF